MKLNELMNCYNTLYPERKYSDGNFPFFFGKLCKDFNSNVWKMKSKQYWYCKVSGILSFQYICIVLIVFYSRWNIIHLILLAALFLLLKYLMKIHWMLSKFNIVQRNINPPPHLHQAQIHYPLLMSLQWIQNPVKKDIFSF